MAFRKKQRNAQWGVPLLFMALCLICAFFIFWRVALPFCGDRLNANILTVALRYLLPAGGLLILFAALVGLWLAHNERIRIYGPLRYLERAAHELRDGRLNYELNVNGLGEFAELGQAVEEMRVRLKDNIAISQKAEAERLSTMNSICHDLKTPVTSILGYAEGILDGVADSPEKVFEYAAVIAQKARRMSALVEDLNYLSVLENAPPLTLELLDAGRWLESFADELRGEAELETDIETELYCLTDKQKLERVFHNLAENAHKYARPPGGELCLRLTARRLDDQILLTMLDNGPGLPPAETGRVFERFYRTDPSRSQAAGSGLGLSIARQIISLLGGKIWLQNYKDGGLLVSVSLPAAGDLYRGSL